jgi:hypothetical protein
MASRPKTLPFWPNAATRPSASEPASAGDARTNCPAAVVVRPRLALQGHVRPFVAASRWTDIRVRTRRAVPQRWRGGLRTVTMPVDEEGALVSSLPRGTGRPRLLLVTPSHQFPLGVRMTIARRLELIRSAQEHNGLVLEDDYDSEFRDDGMELPTLAALDPAQVVYLGTMSKVLSPSVRCGDLAVPREVVSQIIAMKEMIDGSIAWSVQQLVLHLIESGNL